MTSSMSGYAGPQSNGRGASNPGQPFKEKIPKGYGVSSLQQFTPEQMQVLQNLYPHVGEDSYLSRLAGGDQSLFDEMEAPALRQFNELQGEIASRFSQGSGQGSLGARKSSGFQNTQTAAASDFAQQLQSQRQGLQRQGLKDLFEMSHMLMGERPFERRLYEKPQKEKNGWSKFLPLAGAAVGGVFSGPAGAAAGYNIGGAAHQGFSGGGSGKKSRYPG